MAVMVVMMKVEEGKGFICLLGAVKKVMNVMMRLLSFGGAGDGGFGRFGGDL